MMLDFSASDEVFLFLIFYIVAGIPVHLAIAVIIPAMLASAIFCGVRGFWGNLKYGLLVGLSVALVSILGMVSWIVCIGFLATNFPGKDSHYIAIAVGLIGIGVLAACADLWIPLRARYAAREARLNFATTLSTIVVIPGVWIGWTYLCIEVFGFEGTRRGVPLGFDSYESLVIYLAGTAAIMVAGGWLARRAWRKDPSVSASPLKIADATP